MTHQARALLDQLMGLNRDEIPGQGEELLYTDPKVCRPFLEDLCGSELFRNTKEDIGECSKMHLPNHKTEYDAAVASGRQEPYHDELFNYLSDFVNESDRKISRAKTRIESSASETPEATALSNKIHELSIKIGSKMAEAETAGADGRVEESLALMQEVETCKSEKLAAEQEYSRVQGPEDSRQKLRVCDVCAAMLSVTDSDRRLADHFAGKMHQGMHLMRTKLAELRSLGVTGRRKEAPRSSGGGGGGVGYERERSRGRGYDDERRSDRRDDYGRRDDRDRDRDYRDRSGGGRDRDYRDRDYRGGYGGSGGGSRRDDYDRRDRDRDRRY